MLHHLYFAIAKEEGMNVAVHWMDNDSSAALAIGEHFPNAMLMLWVAMQVVPISIRLKQSKLKKDVQTMK